MKPRNVVYAVDELRTEVMLDDFEQLFFGVTGHNQTDYVQKLDLKRIEVEVIHEAEA